MQRMTQLVPGTAAVQLQFTTGERPALIPCYRAAMQAVGLRERATLIKARLLVFYRTFVDERGRTYILNTVDGSPVYDDA